MSRRHIAWLDAVAWAIRSHGQTSRKLLESTPTSRSPRGFAALIPGTTNQRLGTALGGANELEASLQGSSVAASVFSVNGTCRLQLFA